MPVIETKTRAAGFSVIIEDRLKELRKAFTAFLSLEGVAIFGDQRPPGDADHT